MKSMALAGVLGIVLACTSCGSYGNNYNGMPVSTNITGNWQFTYTSSRGGSSTVSGSLTQSGTGVSATVNITGSCAATGTLSATLNGTSLSGTITEGSLETIAITGSVSGDYSSSNGTYQVTSATGSCSTAMGDMGTWIGSRTSLPVGGYGGTVLPADRLPVGVVVTLSHDGGALSGTANFTNSTCLHSMNVAGSVSGLNLELRGSGMDGSMVMSGTMDNAAKTLSLHSSVSGTCSAESGAATLMKLQ
jgi:hypothetical protein